MYVYIIQLVKHVPNIYVCISVGLFNIKSSVVQLVMEW